MPFNKVDKIKSALGMGPSQADLAKPLTMAEVVQGYQRIHGGALPSAQWQAKFAAAHPAIANAGAPASPGVPPSMASGDSNGKPYSQPTQPSNNVNVTVQNTLDANGLTTKVMQTAAREANRPYSGPSTFDSSLGVIRPSY